MPRASSGPAPPSAAPSAPITIALLSSPDLDTRTLTGLRWAGRERRVNATNLKVQDANGDGRADLVLRGTVAELGLELGKQIVCAAGVLPDENPVLTCTPVTLAAAPEPTATPPTDPDPDPTGEPSASADPPTDTPISAGANLPGVASRERGTKRAAAGGRSLDHGGCPVRAHCGAADSARGEEHTSVIRNQGRSPARGPRPPSPMTAGPRSRPASAPLPAIWPRGGPVLLPAAARAVTERGPSASSALAFGCACRLSHQAGSPSAQPFIAMVTRFGPSSK